MLNVTYAIIEEKYTFGNKSRISYGISACANESEEDTFTVIASVHDITPNKEKIINFIDDCNRLKLSTIHLAEVVEDFLSD